MRRVIYLCVLLFLLTSCAKSDYQAGNNQERKEGSVQNTTAHKRETKSNEKKAEHLARLAGSIPNVEKTTAVVFGKYAVVGIDVNGKLDRSRVESIKYSVAESLKHDPHGANAVVVADPDTFQRLQAMRREIQKGNTAGVMDELAAIVGRVMPQIPNDTFEKEHIRSTRENDSQLPAGQQQQLKKEQNDQSNNHMNAK